MTASLNERFTEVLARAAAHLDLPGDNPTLTLARRFGIGGYTARTGERADYQSEVRARRLIESVMLEHAVELSSTLTARGVPHFFFKGIVLARWLYEPGERHFVDVDVCVAPEARGDAVDALRGIGYVELPSANQDGPAELRPGVTLVRGTDRPGLPALNVDIRWGIEPVDRLLPRDDTPIPQSIWQRVATDETLPAPAPEHHAALILHHLVHHDLMHIRSLLDFALLWERLPHEAGAEFEETAIKLGVLRTGRALAAALQRDLGIDPPARVGAPPIGWRGRRLARLLFLEHWLTWAGRATLKEHKAITANRIKRRLLLLDRLGSARHLVADGFWPPQEWLRWRWPEARSARARHLVSAAWKVLGPRTGSGEM